MLIGWGGCLLNIFNLRKGAYLKLGANSSIYGTSDQFYW